MNHFLAIPLADPELSYGQALVHAINRYLNHSCRQLNQLAEMLGIGPKQAPAPLRDNPGPLFESSGPGSVTGMITTGQ